MTDQLTDIYDGRLKALIGYTDTRFTRELIQYMFDYFEYLGEKTPEDGYIISQPTYFKQILAFLPGNGALSGSVPGKAAYDLNTRLENFIRNTLRLLLEDYPEWKGNYTENDWRSVMGKEFRKKVRANPGRYPAPLYKDHFFSQLNYTTMYRNHLAHIYRNGNSGMYQRYQILKSYDTILCYLLYTFYYMCLKKDTPDSDDQKRVETLKNYLYVNNGNITE